MASAAEDATLICKAMVADMTVTFCLTEDDWVYLTRCVWHRTETRGTEIIIWGTLGFVTLMVGSLSSVLIVSSIVSKSYSKENIIGLLISLFLTGVGIELINKAIRLTFWGTRQFLRRYFHMNPDAFAEQSMSLHASHIDHRRGNTSAEVRWADLVDIVDEGRYILMITEAGTKAGYVVPKAAFASPGLADRFFLAASAYWKGEEPPKDDTTWPPPPSA